ncbi:MAG TPA: nitrogen fixation protein NifX [Nitrospirae bacterium]|nr:dinitrogenase iron-molybdenum cofactor [bacterium BMS3Abin08]HDO36104.1 nitrogen fixation protein NifX [Nitrospirota bacterium]HDY71387.1 nitrogen fixation protein NifX [Nitrospirota bacterium]
MKVAFATTDGKNVDEHFGRCGMFAIYDVMKDGYQFAELRKFAEGRDTAIEETREIKDIHEDRVQRKVDKLADCKIIYITDIGGPSAARLSRKGIMPVKVKEVVSIEDALTKLLETFRQSPTPWLRRAMEE